MNLSRRAGIALATTVLALPLAACGGNDKATTTPASGASSAAEQVSYPITIKHAFGSTTIKSKPVRVATLGWANHEVPLALGVVPVGMSKATWGDDNHNGILPWVEDKLKELGGQQPVLFDETDGVPFEAVANTKPDVILAAYSGITKADYDKLSKIAPVIAYPKTAWGTSLDEMITMDSEAMGMGPQGKQLASDLDKKIAEIASHHESLKGKKFIFANVDAKDMSKIGFYTTHDPRVGFLTEKIGMAAPAAVTAASATSSQFWQQVSAERGDTLADVDLAVSYGDDKTPGLWKSNALLSKIGFIDKGRVAILPNDTPLAAAANPSPLSIAWGLDKYLDLLQAAADKK